MSPVLSLLIPNKLNPSDPLLVVRSLRSPIAVALTPTHSKPPPDLVERQEEYKVDHIKRHRCVQGGKVHYLVHWRDYDNTGDT